MLLILSLLLLIPAVLSQTIVLSMITKENVQNLFALQGQDLTNTLIQITNYTDTSTTFRGLSLSGVVTFTRTEMDGTRLYVVDVTGKHAPTSLSLIVSWSSGGNRGPDLLQCGGIQRLVFLVPDADGNFKGSAVVLSDPSFASLRTIYKINQTEWQDVELLACN
jgi:hypothetical protein